MVAIIIITIIIIVIIVATVIIIIIINTVIIVISVVSLISMPDARCPSSVLRASSSTSESSHSSSLTVCFRFDSVRLAGFDPNSSSTTASCRLDVPR